MKDFISLRKRRRKKDEILVFCCQKNKILKLVQFSGIPAVIKALIYGFLQIRTNQGTLRNMGGETVPFSWCVSLRKSNSMNAKTSELIRLFSIVISLIATQN